jgi:TRAP-type uncharacterized transport system substrate-binding protein
MRRSLRLAFWIAKPPAGPMKRARRIARRRRIRIMMQHTWLIVIAVLLLCAGLVGAVYYYNTLPTQLRIAVGPPNNEDTRLVQAIAAQLARDRTNIHLTTIVLPGGTREAAAAIDNDTTDLAVVRHDTGMPKDGKVVAILRKNVVAFIVPSVAEAPKPAKGKAKTKAAAKAPSKTEPVEKISDLVGRRLGVVGRSPNNIEVLKVILRQYNVSPDKIVILMSEDLAKPNAPDRISVIQYDPNNVAAAIRESNVDAIMSVGPVSSPITADAIAAATRDKEPPKFIALTAAEAIAERNPIYESTEIKAGAFGGSPPRPEESVETIGVNHYIVARRQLDDQTVADFTKHLFAIRQVLSADLPAAAKIEKPDTDKDAAVPVHPGAAAYLDGELKSFFDRYNDWIYLGLMVFSLLGSALAGLLSYNKADDRVRRLEGLVKLLEITKEARTATALPVMDDLQARLDAIQADMIREVEANALDQTALMAFSLSFEQARLAIADRRAALLGQPRPPLAAVASA